MHCCRCRSYLEQPESGVLLTGGSLAVRQAATDTHMMIDPATAAALELVQPIRVGIYSTRLSGLSLFRCGVAVGWAVQTWVLVNVTTCLPLPFMVAAPSPRRFSAPTWLP